MIRILTVSNSFLTVDVFAILTLIVSVLKRIKLNAKSLNGLMVKTVYACSVFKRVICIIIILYKKENIRNYAKTILTVKPLRKNAVYCSSLSEDSVNVILQKPQTIMKLLRTIKRKNWRKMPLHN